MKQVIDELLFPGIIAVVRALRTEQALPIAQALLDGGVRAIEITMTTPNALAAIQEVSAALGNKALIGVGTVLDAGTCSAAIRVGAKFVVSPITRGEIVEAAHQKGAPVMLGACTPTEAQTAYELGADFIKLFPADGLGPNYVKALRAPLPHLKIVPTGGVDLSTVGPFMQAGCVALGVGSSMISSEILKKNDWPALTRNAAAFIEAMKEARARVSG